VQAPLLAEQPVLAQDPVPGAQAVVEEQQMLFEPHWPLEQVLPLPLHASPGEVRQPVPMVSQVLLARQPPGMPGVQFMGQALPLQAKLLPHAIGLPELQLPAPSQVFETCMVPLQLVPQAVPDAG
jgi:hypothetical protein